MTLKKIEERRSNSSLDSCPWYDALKEIFMLKPFPNDFESFNHPIACFLGVSTSDPDPVSSFGFLFDSITRLQPIESGLVDPNILKCCILISDSRTETRNEE